MNKRQLFAYRNATKNPLASLSFAGKSKQIINLKGLKLSTLISVDWLGEYFAWHASIAVLTSDGFSQIPSNKVSAANRTRAEIQLEKLLEGVGEEYIRQSEAHGTFNLFRRLTDEEAKGLEQVSK